MNQDPVPQRSFGQTFFGSFGAIKDYPLFAERSLGSALLHFFLLVTLLTGISAAMTAQWVKSAVEPHAMKALEQVPSISIKDGVASSSIPQPHVINIENQPFFIMDTTQDPQVYLDQHSNIAVLSKDRITIKKENGEIRSHELAGNLEISSSISQGWYEIAASWILPVFVALGIVWQLIWKAVQVLLVAGIVTLFHTSRPGFGTHLRIACYALSPALAWGFIVQSAWLAGIPIPFAGLVFWGILTGITVKVASTIRNSPKYH